MSRARSPTYSCRARIAALSRVALLAAPAGLSRVAAVALLAWLARVALCARLACHPLLAGWPELALGGRALLERLQALDDGADIAAEVLADLVEKFVGGLVEIHVVGAHRNALGFIAGAE